VSAIRMTEPLPDVAPVVLQAVRPADKGIIKKSKIAVTLLG